MALNLTLLSDSLLSDLSTAVCHYIFVITVWIHESLMRENPTMVGRRADMRNE
ncbi:hypothetical protein ABH945_005512 [Paraburkholderia sp. GAS333]